MTESEVDARIERLLKRERQRELIENRQRHGVMIGSDLGALRSRRKIRRLEQKSRGF